MDFATMINNITAELTPVLVPLGILGVLLWGISILAQPILPDWAAQNSGYFRKAMMILVFLSFAPAMIAWLTGLGGTV